MEYKDLPPDTLVYRIDQPHFNLNIYGYLEYISSRCAFNFDYEATDYNDFLIMITIKLNQNDVPSNPFIMRTVIIDPGEVTVGALKERFLDIDR